MKAEKDHTNLIESLKKLIRFASNGTHCQREIFSSFNRNDFQKIMQNFEDENAVLRQLSFKLMTLLLSKCKDNRIEFCRVFDVFPVRGRLVLNKIPPTFAKEGAAKLLAKLRDASFGSGRLLYLSNGNEIVLPLEHRNFAEDSFLDPSDTVVLVLVEEEMPSPRKSFFNEEKASTPRRKNTMLRSSNDIEYGIDCVNNSVPNSPRDSIHSFESKARRS